MGAKKRTQEDDLNILLCYLRERRGERWVIVDRPDQTNRNRPDCDFVVKQTKSGMSAAVEVTSFDWPMDRITMSNTIRSVCEEVMRYTGGKIAGKFSLNVDTMVVRLAGLFAKGNRASTKKRIIDTLTREPMMQIGETRAVDSAGLSVMRLSDTGRMYIGSSSVTTVDFARRLDQLNEVIYDQVKKFVGREEMTTWLLVSLPGVEHILEITGPILDVPREIQELFFIDYEDPSSAWPPTEIRSAIPRIVEYSKVKQPNYGGTYDRETGTVKVIVPSSGAPKP